MSLTLECYKYSCNFCGPCCLDLWEIRCCGGCSVVSSLLDTLMLFWLSQLICHPPNLSSKVWTSAPATRAFYLSKILIYFFKIRNHPSYIPTNQFIQLYMPCVFAFCLRSLQGQMFPWLFIPSEYFLALLPTEALSPLTTLKKLYINLMQLLMIISLSFWCHCCFLLYGKKDNPPALFCLQEVTSDNKTPWKLQDI